MFELSAASLFDSLASCALASAGLAFSAVALLKIAWIACHHIFHALARHWNFCKPVEGISRGKP
jgi:hypothetical protein